MSNAKRKYIDKDGNERNYTYDYTEYDKEYNKNRNKNILRLQQQKSYYKRKGDFERVKTCELLINIEKRRNKIEEE